MTGVLSCACAGHVDIAFSVGCGIRFGNIVRTSAERKEPLVSYVNAQFDWVWRCMVRRQGRHWFHGYTEWWRVR